MDGRQRILIKNLDILTASEKFHADILIEGEKFMPLVQG